MSRPKPTLPTLAAARRSLAVAAAWCACATAAPADPAAAPTTTAEPVAPVPVAAPPAAPAPTTSRAEVYAEFRRLFEAGSYEQAVPSAQQLVAFAESQGGASSEELQVALMNLATTQYFSGDYVGAEASYQRVIALAEESGRPLSDRLARANAGLAGTYYAGKRYDLAVERFERAVALSRRSEGLLNERQLPMLDKYADALTQLGRLEDALKVQRYALRVATRRYGENDPRIAPPLEKLGRWYAKVGAYDASRATLRHAIDIVSKASGENAPELVGPLTALAECDRLQLQDPSQRQGTSPDTDRNGMFHDPMEPAQFSATAAVSEGQKALERAADIAAGRKDPAPAQLADVRTQLGDWYQSLGQSERALPQYQQAWTAAANLAVAGKPLRELLFGKPVLLGCARPEAWNRYAGRPKDEVELRTVQVSVTVTAEGRTKDARLLDDSGDAKRGKQTLAAVESARYRPRLADGKPVETTDVQFFQPWFVLLPKPATPGAAPQQAAAPDKQAEPKP